MARRGSSPLARGTRGAKPPCTSLQGLIPARAGNTVVIVRLPSRTGAHPRSRGEHMFSPGETVSFLGSSPLARGTHDFAELCVCANGLIPARAGNTGRPRPSTERGRAHPRSRGEHAIRGLPRACRRGSSPLARGTPIFSIKRMNKSGLIPARAGNTLLVV